MKRRHFLSALALGGLGYAAYRYWPDDGFLNPCLQQNLPESFAQHPLVTAAWEGIDADKFWDTHVHLIGDGDSNNGIWVNPNMSSILHPLQWIQHYFYFNASCADSKKGVDHSFIDRLLHLKQAFPAAAKLMLLAFDYFYNERGDKIIEASSFHTPDDYAQRIAAQYPESFEWIASIHPYRSDALAALEHAIENGAKAVKWLPAAQGMDPASAHCDAFYELLVQQQIPFVCNSELWVTSDTHLTLSAFGGKALPPRRDSVFSVQTRALELYTPLMKLSKEMNVQHRTPNVQRRMKERMQETECFPFD